MVRLQLAVTGCQGQAFQAFKLRCEGSVSLSAGIGRLFALLLVEIFYASKD